MNKILVIDLTTKDHHEIQIDQDQAKDFIGGSGEADRV